MIKIPPEIEYVLNTLIDSGYEAYIIGGCVRDSLMGIMPHDFDIATSAHPENVQDLFEKTVPTGIKHGTVTVISGKTPVEVTTFRTESGYKDSRHPDNIHFVSSIKEDLSRRDFTVNAIAYNSKNGIVDYFGGQNDIKNSLLRAVGNPQERFSEDALRILRLFRFASTLNFSCEENTFKAALKCAPALEKISRERIFSELYKAVTGDNFQAFAPLIQNGGLKFIKICKVPDFSIIRSLPSAKIAFFTFLYLSSEDIHETLEILKVSNKLKHYCKDLNILIKKDLPETKTQIKSLLCDYSPEILFDCLLLKNILTGSDISVQRKMLENILEYKEPFLINHLDIDGNTIRKMGFESVQIGKILKQLQSVVIEHPEKNNLKDLLIEIKRISQ